MTRIKNTGILYKDKSVQKFQISGQFPITKKPGGYYNDITNNGEYSGSNFKENVYGGYGNKNRATAAPVLQKPKTTTGTTPVGTGTVLRNNPNDVSNLATQGVNMGAQALDTISDDDARTYTTGEQLGDLGSGALKGASMGATVGGALAGTVGSGTALGGAVGALGTVGTALGTTAATGAGALAAGTAAGTAAAAMGGVTGAAAAGAGAGVAAAGGAGVATGIAGGLLATPIAPIAAAVLIGLVLTKVFKGKKEKKKAKKLDDQAVRTQTNAELQKEKTALATQDKQIVNAPMSTTQGKVDDLYRYTGAGPVRYKSGGSFARIILKRAADTSSLKK
jgi:hypothetical protein